MFCIVECGVCVVTAGIECLSHLFIIRMLIFINHGCYQLRRTHFHITYKLMDIETSSDNLYRRFVVCISGVAEISNF